MHPAPNDFLETHRLTTGRFASDRSYGNNGAFLLPSPTRHRLFIIASDGGGWEHVSVSPQRQKRTPTWEEMCYVKGLFWADDECVIQYHPPESDYVRLDPYTLHLWRPVGHDLPRPPHMMVGPKTPQELAALLPVYQGGNHHG